MDNKIDIDQIIHNKILGIISQEEQVQLDSWCRADQKHQQRLDRLMEEKVLAKRYREYRAIDEETAWKTFRQAHFNPENKIDHLRKWLAAAAVVAAVSGAFFWFANRQTAPAPVTLSPKARQAQILSKESGREAATLKVGQRLRVKVNNIQEYHDAMEKVAANTICQLSTKDVKEFWITLEDGTMVHLNYDTELRYPAHFNSDNRTVYLKGEAYFKVAKDASRPFFVSTHNGTVKEYGTEFNINTQTEDGSTDVVLIEGTISVKSNNGTEQMLHPGEKATLSAGKTEADICKVDISSYKAWNEGEYIFKNCRMKDLMNVICHWYGYKEVYQSNEARDILFTGCIDRYGKMESILEAINKVTGLKIEIKDKCIVIK